MSNIAFLKALNRKGHIKDSLFNKFTDRSENRIRLVCKLDFDGLYKDFLEEFNDCTDGADLFFYLRKECGINPLDFLEIAPENFFNFSNNYINIVIKENIKEIEGFAFCNDSFLNVEIKSESVILNNSSFLKCKIKKLTIPKKFKKQIKSIFKECKIKKIKYIKDRKNE